MNNQIDNAIIINGVNYDLIGLEEFAWKKLINGYSKKKNGFRTMCLGTIGPDNASALRIVINRKVDELQKSICFHTDNRSRKFQDIKSDNRVSLLFYDARQKIQIAIKAHAFLPENNLLAIDRWKATSPQARLGYMTIESPNTKSEKPTLGYNEKFSEIKPTDIESDFYQKNFDVIVCKVYELEFLYLDYSGNRKANFYYENGVLKNSFWVVP